MKVIEKAPVVSAVLFPVLVYAQNTSWLKSIITEAKVTIPRVLGFLLAVALVFFVYGLVRFMLKTDDEREVTEGKKRMVWGIVALFVIVSVWGLVTLLQQVFGIPWVSFLAPQVDV